MSQILYVCSAEPKFPPSDQHPDAVRYTVGPYWVDALGGTPTLAEVEAYLGTDAHGLAFKQRLTTDEGERLQAKIDAAVIALVDATPAQLVTYARNNFPTLSLAEQNKLGVILHILAVAVRPHVRS